MNTVQLKSYQDLVEKQNPKNVFLYCFIIGILGISLSLLNFLSFLFSFIVPVLAVSLFATYSYFKVRALDASRTSLADACYYLGFLFTLSNVCIVLLSISNDQNSLQTLVNNFGSATVSSSLEM